MSTIRRLLAALAILGMLAGLVSVASILIFSDHSNPAAPPSATPRTTLPPSVPTPKEFTINVVVTERDCQPGGGCVYKERTEPKGIGFPPLPGTPLPSQR